MVTCHPKSGDVATSFERKYFETFIFQIKIVLDVMVMDLVPSFWTIFFGGTIFLFFYYVSQCLVKVPANHVAIVSGRGKHRVIKPGFHVVMWPTESLEYVKWSFMEEEAYSDHNGRNGVSTRTVMIDCDTCFINMKNNKIDVVPQVGYTRRNVEISLNGTLHYKIDDPIKAVTQTPNLLGFITECVAESTLDVISQLQHDELVGVNTIISQKMTSSINEKIQPYGAVCTKFAVQSISMNKDIQKGLETQIVLENQRKTNAAKMLNESELHMTELTAKSELERARMAEHDKQLAMEHAHKSKRLEEEQRLLETKQKFDMDFARREKELAVLKADYKAIKHKSKAVSMLYAKEREREIELSFVNGLLDKGYTPQHATLLATAHHMAEAAKKTDKWFLSPQDACSMGIPWMMYNHTGYNTNSQ